MDFGAQQFGKWLLAIGVLIAVIGVLVLLLGKIGLFRLPGDFEFGGRHWRVSPPVSPLFSVSSARFALEGNRWSEPHPARVG